MTSRGKIIETFSIYSEECLIRLKNALAKAEETGDNNDALPTTTEIASSHLISSRYADSSSFSSDEEDSEGGGNESETSSSEESLNEDDGEDKKSREKEADDGAADEQVPSPDAGRREAVVTAPGTAKRPTKLKTKQREVLKHVEILSCIALPLTEPENTALEIPSSLLSKEERLSNYLLLKQCRSCLSLATALQEKTVVVLFLRSGRFAGAVFQRDDCICHRTIQKYTVRKGQGKAQSAQDSQRRPKSMGSQLRRAGEQRLKEDVTKTILEWKDYVQQAALILVSCPKTMKKSLFDGLQEQILSKNDPRIRRVPLDLGRPTFENVCLIHSVMMTATVREINLPGSVAQDTDTSTNVVTEEEAKIHGRTEPYNSVVDTEDEPIEIPLTALHVAAQEADLDNVLSLLESDECKEQINQLAGEFLMTPLHLAAGSAVDGGGNVQAAADCVYQLLVTGRADPCLVDVRNRPPYFLASSDKVRDAFRKARDALGEDYCDWDDGGKVGPPLTEEDIRLKKEKEAEKKRKKRARQKEKKAKEKAHAEAMEKQRREEEERRKQEEDAKRIRDGLQPKVRSGGNVCDYCQKVCKGKRRSQMFQRLEYAYCSTDCVQKHKRELMASAALSRLE